ncbi:histone deacetylase 6 [Cynara cardunculus var. scolymus]|uniref:Histone deacetylase superfamily n=1 Tax=Cynara cardunculus var. scolymus TaxID=59895 RepID=A0A103Y3L6_CYNCS|nr:histone deacetylase 6 [Cynara cardunculus var. scolymus]KVI01913.1 Histone deacetylase superfamily [Cynara cardunculus var. scolymus]
MGDKEKTVCDSSSSSRDQSKVEEEEEEALMALYGSESGWVEARIHCDHLDTLSSDLIHIPTPDTPCNRCHHPAENWLCLSCKDVLCSRFINKHMLDHYQQQNHSVALSFSDLSVWCFSCNSYLDAQVMLPLRPVYETAYILKFGEAPPVRTVEFLQVDDSTSGN